MRPNESVEAMSHWGWCVVMVGVLGSAVAAQQAGPTGAEPTDAQASASRPSPDPPASQVESVSSSYSPGEGITVSMLNGTSRLKVFAQFSGISVFSTDRPFSSGLPLLLLPPSPFGLSTNTFDLHARQTSFGASFTGPDVLGCTPGAFFLGFIQNDNLTSDAYGFLPYQAYGELKNDNWRLAAGLQSDVFNPGKPTIISLGSLFGSGNTGSFRGQVRAEHFFKPSDTFQLTCQLAISEPVATIVTNNRRILEDNGWPNVEARLALALGSVEELSGSRKLRCLELGVSGVVGQLRTTRLITAPTDPEVPNRAVVDVWGLGVDGQWAVTPQFGFAGEFFIGQGLGEYNGGVLQSFNSETFQAIRTCGGWGEAYCYFSDNLHLHAGYGVDAPLRRDLAPTQFARNQTYFANLVWDATKVFQISFEVDYRKTNYIAFANADGVVFLTQMLWRF